MIHVDDDKILLKKIDEMLNTSKDEDGKRQLKELKDIVLNRLKLKKREAILFLLSTMEIEDGINVEEFLKGFKI